VGTYPNTKEPASASRSAYRGRQEEEALTVISPTHRQKQDVDTEGLGKGEGDGDGTSLAGEVRVLVVDGLSSFGGSSVVPVIGVGDLQRGEEEGRERRRDERGRVLRGEGR
jgi:hypothetical protein